MLSQSMDEYVLNCTGEVSEESTEAKHEPGWKGAEFYVCGIQTTVRPKLNIAT
jgi:hypothetical protein